MRSRPGRLILFIMLLLVGIVAAKTTWDLQTRSVALAAAEQDLDTRFERMIATTAEIAAAQQAYVVPGQPDDTWFARVASLLGQLSSDVEAVSSRARSADAAAALQTLTEATRAFVQLDAQVREHLRFSEELIAADLIFSDGRSAIDTAAKELRGIREAERAASTAERAALNRQTWTTLGASALLWLVGLMLLTRVPTTREDRVTTVVETGQSESRAASVSAPLRPPLNLEAAAEVCTAISRMTRAEELDGLLARAATVLDASGLIVWMSAGEELFAVAAHGYESHVVNRLGSISRTADNATGASWRTGQLNVVAGDMLSNGAVVAPMFGPESCIGALAAEVRHGREEDADARAITAMFAAQLATAVVAWPAASTHVTNEQSA